MPITPTSISVTQPKGNITFAAKSIQASLQGLLNGHSIKKWD